MGRDSACYPQSEQRNNEAKSDDQKLFHVTLQLEQCRNNSTSVVVQSVFRGNIENSVYRCISHGEKRLLTHKPAPICSKVLQFCGLFWRAYGCDEDTFFVV